MAGKLEPLEVEPPGVVEEAEAGQTKSSKKSDDLLAMVKKLQKEGSLEPQIEDLINRINELQQAKKKSSEELGEAQGLWETLHRELDSLNGEKVHLEEVLSKKQEALRILQLHCQMKDSEAQRLHVKEQLDLMGQHKDLWEFQILKQRLTWEIHSLQRSKEQLLTEENLARAKLQQVERRLRLPPVVEGAPAVNDALKAELEKFGGHGPAQTQSASGDPTNEGEVGSPGRKRGGQGGRQSGQVCLQSPSERGSGETRASQGVTVTEQGSLTPCSGRPAPSSWAPAVRRTWSRRWSWHWRLPKPVGLARCSPNFKAQQEIKAMISIRPSSPGLSLRSRSH
ncbi:synaptonemal complex central element protein 1-like [Pteropus medius]|uniref:synaptonemal complex central element protein 1-like n=1 Tax=Pteropus vampyrus TaxID=132908 RepID=UPI00196B3204|nr:synaptonemal complex central element protein 1-like [Pteropus giganteus]